MTYIAPRTEALARAMCVALNVEPDKDSNIYNDFGEYMKRWEIYRWQAQLWIYEHSGGELPEREGGTNA